MKILIATDTYYPHVNGASYFSQRLAHYLSEHGHTVVVIAPSISFQNTKSDIDGILVYGVWSMPILFYDGFRFVPLPFMIQRSVERAISEFNPDIVHIQSHFFLSRTALFVARKKGIPVVGTNHFMPENLVHYLRLPKPITRFIKNIMWRDFAKIFNKADYVTIPTKTASELIPYPFKLPVPVHVLSNGIDLIRFNKNNNGEILKKRYQIPNKLVLLFVGRLDHEKNLDFVLKVAARALKKADFHLIIAGKGAEEKNLKNLSNKLGIDKNVTFAGFVPDEDLPNLYKAANCFINACAAELQCLAVMEAMASGLPVILVNALALPELIQNGKNGFLFEEDDVAGAAEAIVKIFKDSNLRKSMGEASLKIIQNHDIHKTIEKFENVYKELVAGRYATLNT